MKCLGCGGAEFIPMGTYDRMCESCKKTFIGEYVILVKSVNTPISIRFMTIEYAKECIQKSYNRQTEGEIEWVEINPNKINGIDPHTKLVIFKIVVEKNGV